jgi:hypothetical protein
MRDQERLKRSDLEAHDWVTGLTIHEVVRELTDILGATTVAVIGGVKEARAVQQWMEDRVPQQPHVLRFALQLAAMLTNNTDREFAKAWFHSPNPRLEDRIPMLILRDVPLEQSQGEMLRAARAFSARDDQTAS